MARLQIARGNPEEKKYILFDNFSGGINTTKIDEQMLTNEFRYLQNVELIEQGRIQNRKGFAKVSVLNQLLFENSINLKQVDALNKSDFFIVKVTKDTHNVLRQLTDAPTLAYFKQSMAGVKYELDFFIVEVVTTPPVPNTGLITFGYIRLLKFRNTSDNYTIQSTLPITLHSSNILRKKEFITNTPSITFENEIIFSLNDIFEDKIGIAKWNFETETYTLIDNSTAYTPSPYEVTNLGFNVLNTDPLKIKTEAIGISEIRGIYLTDTNDDQMVLSNIPQNGEFVLNVIYKGADLKANDLTIETYTEDLNGVKTYLDNSYTIVTNSDSSGVFKYKMNLRLEGNREIFIQVKKLEYSQDFDKEFATTTDLINYYTTRPTTLVEVTSGVGTNRLYDLFVPKTTPYNYELKEILSGQYNYLGVTYTIGNTKLDSVPILQYDSSTGTIVPVLYGGSTFRGLKPCILFDTSLNTQSLGYVLIYDGMAKGYIVKESAPTYIRESSVFEKTISTDKLLKVSTAYYRWNEGTLGTLGDFTTVTEIEVDISTLKFILPINVGVNEAKKLIPIDLRGVKLLQINNRLVLYKGNTIVFSDLFKFDYFPNYNYILFPLIGNDEIQKIAYFRGSYIVFNKESLYRISGDFGESDFKVVMINDSIGCVSPESIRSINNTLIFFSNDGLYTIKQNFYMEGLENLEKVDKNIKGLIPYGQNFESIVYNEQYLLLVKDRENNYVKTVKQYYNMNVSAKEHPYVIDIYTKNPENLMLLESELYSIKNGLFYIYNKGYTDFAPDDIDLLPDEINEYMYKLTIKSPNYTFGYPTHDKKFKNIYVKTDSVEPIPIYITLYVNNSIWSTPYSYVAEINESGEIEYREILNKVDLTTLEGAEDNLLLSEKITDEQIINTIDPDLVLGNFELGLQKLGLNRYQVHKIITGAKGKALSIMIEQKTDKYFGFEIIGVLHKLGKVRESR